jgi:hypothetical protein
MCAPVCISSCDTVTEGDTKTLRIAPMSHFPEIIKFNHILKLWGCHISGRDCPKFCSFPLAIGSQWPSSVWEGWSFWFHFTCPGLSNDTVSMENTPRSMPARVPRRTPQCFSLTVIFLHGQPWSEEALPELSLCISGAKKTWDVVIGSPVDEAGDWIHGWREPWPTSKWRKEWAIKWIN